MASEISNISRSKIQALISSGHVLVNEVPIVDANYNLKKKDRIIVNEDVEIEKPSLAPDAEVKFSVIYEDEDLLVINKPAGVVVHPGAGNYSSTLVNGLTYHCGESLSKGSGEFRPGIVHRIDKDTSGILVVAKNDFTHAELSKQFAVHSITRKYVCFCYSIMQPPCGKIETLIARDKNNRLKMAAFSDHGKNAITLYKTVRMFSRFASKIECELKTGRTHQVRVHMSHLGHSLIGDSLYKIKNYASPKEISDYLRNFPRQALHAYFLEFLHPRSQKSMLFEAVLPSDLKELEAKLAQV